ncbi:MAG: PbsX family transcriptional regulator [Betaproteobacteria bacterium]|nr:PbsX family transcriptional regulator [Betaproteobacteria bacterium]
MDAVIRKWGNSPAVRINAAAMKIASFDIEQRVTIKATKGRIVIEPADKLEFKLEELVAGITRENVHDEADFGAPVGKEAL